MQTVTFTKARRNLAAVLDKACGALGPGRIDRRHGSSVVVLRLSEWTAIQETLHLQSIPANAARLIQAIAQLDADPDAPAP
jgi:antitoxin YefM